MLTSPAYSSQTANVSIIFLLLPLAVTHLATNVLGDPWREVTVSSDFYNRKSTDLQPIAVSDGFHCSDLITRFGAADKTVYDVQQLAVAYFTKWVKDWQAEHPEAVKGGPVTVINPASVPAPPAFAPAVSPPSNPSPITVSPNVTAPTSAPAPANNQAKKVVPNSFNFGNQ